MKRGKAICNALKSIRQKVADENGIDYKPVKCDHKGDCLGTCPACEAEVRYLDQRLNAMRLAGKAVKIAGISLGIAALTACHSSKNKPSSIRGKYIIEQPTGIEPNPYQDTVEISTEK
ncbi:MAG: hypothetical protein IJM81_03445 [Prevotella sp.]|nr:hypothetical protein [Prevotella sp.]